MTSSEPYTCFKVLRVADRTFLYDRGLHEIFEIDSKTALVLEHGSPALGDKLSSNLGELSNLDPGEFQQRLDFFRNAESSWRLLQPMTIAMTAPEKISLNPRTVEFIITGRCNQKCFYCAARDRYVSQDGTYDMMTLDIAARSVDLVRRYYDGGRLVLRFFGGEPLLAFDIVRMVVDSFDQYGIDSTKIISTNGLLLNESIVDFLVQKGFRTFISLDGPKNVHDAYRRTIKGEGTYETVVGRLRMIKNRYPDYFRSHVVINMVVAPEYAGKYIEHVKHIESLGIEPHQIHPGDTIPTSEKCTHYNMAEISKVRWEKAELRKSIINQMLNDQCHETNESYEAYCRFRPSASADVHNNPGEESPDYMIFEDCQSRCWSVLTIWPDGKISACLDFERRDDLVFGDVNTGQLYFEKLASFQELFRNSVVVGECSTCWAARFCTFTGCYIHFARNMCRPDWQNPTMCEYLQDDVRERMEDYLMLLMEQGKA